MDRDGFIELSISDDGMSVTGSFFPPRNEGRPLTPDYLESILEARGIAYGVQSEALSEVVFEVNTTLRARENVLVAEGTPPVSARPAFYRVLPVTNAGDRTLDGDTGHVDHKQVSRLPVVHKGRTIARLVPEQVGKPGYNVRGEELPFTTLTVDTVRPGKNTRTCDDQIIAAIGGQLQVRDGEITVEDRLEISGDVGYETGNIEFPGDVSLKGEVRDGFHIWAGGSITAAGAVDVSEVYCRKDFIAAGGIIGRGRALLRCGGRVQSRFVGNCSVESKTSVFVKQYVYHSHIGCLERFAMGNRGRVIGGILTVAEGVRCYTLGNAARVPTVVRVGINFIVERKLQRAHEKHQAIVMKLQKLGAALPENPSDRQLDILHRLESTRNKLVKQMGDLAGSLDRYEQAEVIVDGDLFPGVQIQICRATFVVEEPMKKMRFSLDKNVGRVLAEPIDVKP